MNTFLWAAGWENGVIRQWHAASGEVLQMLARGARSLQPIACSPDGKLLVSACYADYSIRIWDLRTGNVIRSIVGSAGTVRCAARRGQFAPSGAILATAGDRSVKLWSVATGKARATLIGHRDVNARDNLGTPPLHFALLRAAQTPAAQRGPIRLQYH